MKHAKTLKWFLCLCCLLAALCVFIHAANAEIVDSGTCGAEGDGSNLAWTLDDAGMLTISGMGGMVNYSYRYLSSDNYYTTAPWGSSVSNLLCLKTVVIQNGVMNIGDYAFCECARLTSVTIPDGVTNIGEYTFCDCMELAAVTIPDSVTNIGEFAFNGCNELTSVAIGNGVKSIEWGTFGGCKGLSSVSIPNSVTSIGDYAFYNCKGLKDVYYGGSKTQWEQISISDYNDPIWKATIHYNHLHFPGAAVKENVVEPTCTQNGSYASAVYCDLCGKELSRETVTVVATGHSYGAWEKLDDTQHQRVCANDKTHVEKEDHTWDDGEITTPTTCTEDGVKTYTCTVCKATKTETVTATGHSFGEWKKLDETQHQRVCANDPTHVETAEHVWDDGTVTTGPTDKAEGVKTFTCTICGATKTEPIPKTKPTQKPGDVDGDGELSSGDARLALRASVGLEENIKPGSNTYLAADADGDGDVTSGDARLILRASVGLEDASKFGKKA